MPLVEWSQTHRREPFFLVASNGFDAVVVYSHPLVGVSEGDVERQIIVERVVVGGGSGGVVELSERGLGDAKLNLVQSEYKPEDEEPNAEDETAYAEEPEDVIEKAPTDTPSFMA